MPGKVRTAEELLALPPAERAAVFDASVARDLHDVPSEFLDKVSSRVLKRIAAAGTDQR